MQNANPTLLKHIEINCRVILGDDAFVIKVHLKVEPSYIEVCAAWKQKKSCYFEDLKTAVHLISLKTLQIESSLSVKKRRVEYDQGLLLIASRYERIRIIDAATGTYLHEIQTNHRFVTETRYPRDTRI